MMFLQEVLHLLPTVCLLLVKPKCTWTATRPPHWGLQSAQLGREACCWWMATGGGSSPSRITRSSTTTPAKIPRLIQQTALSTPTTKGPHKNHHNRHPFTSRSTYTTHAPNTTQNQSTCLCGLVYPSNTNTTTYKLSEEVVLFTSCEITHILIRWQNLYPGHGGNIIFCAPKQHDFWTQLLGSCKSSEAFRLHVHYISPTWGDQHDFVYTILP